VAAALRPAFDYWLGGQGGDWAPSISAFRLEDLPPALIPWCVIVDVRDDPLDYVYRFWGTKRTRLLGRDFTGRSVHELSPDAIRESVYAEYEEVRCSRQPMISRHPAPLSSSQVVHFESIRLPITRDGDAVDRIFATICYQDFTEDHYRLFGTDNYAMGF